MRVLALFPHPIGYRLAFLERLVQEPEMDLTVLYCSPDPATRSPVPFTAVGSSPRTSILPGITIGNPDPFGVPLYFNPAVIQWISPRKADVLVVAGYSFPSAVLAAITARLRGLPWILMSDSHWGSSGWSTGIRGTIKRAFVRSVVKLSSGFFVPGTPQRQYLLDMGAQPDLVFHVGLACDVELWRKAAESLLPQAASLRAKFHVSSGHVVSTVGRLLPEKGIEDLLRGFKSFQETHPHWHLMIVGDGPHRVRLQRMTEAERIPKVRFTGALPPDTVQEIYAISDLFCLPSHKEPWGVVITEALAAGVPAIVSGRVGAGPDLIGRTGAGLIVPERSPSAIAEALTALAEDKTMLARMRQATWTAVAPYSVKNCVRQFAAACRTVLERQRTPHENRGSA